MNERIDNLNNKILPNQNLENLSPFMSETDYQDEQEREFLQDDHTNYLETTSWELILEIFNEFLFGYDKSRVDSHGDLDHHHEFLMLHSVRKRLSMAHFFEKAKGIRLFAL